MSAARKSQHEVVVTEREIHKSGEHSIELDRIIRNTFEEAFENDLQTTAQVSKFELEEVLSSPEVRPTDPPPTPVIQGVPIVNVVAEDQQAIVVGSLPPPAIEVSSTKEEERDP
jgi:hypothetical protein